MIGSLRTRLNALLGGPDGLDRPVFVTRRFIAETCVAVLVLAIVIGVRLYRLDTVPAEWYGDIATVWEYAMTTRELDFPPGLYSLGVGPLYPLTVSALLAVTGSTYYVMKLAAVLWSLVGLAALFVLCRRLAGTALATLATLVAGTGSWLLVYSRLGDVEAAVPFLAMGSLALAARIVETRPTSVAPAVLCGLVTGASLYCYGAAFAVPILVTATLAGMYLFMPRPRFAARHLIVYAVTLLLSFAPMVASFRSMEDVTEGHFGSRLVRADVAGTLLRNLATALSVYVIEGDPVSRGNPQSLPHVDPVGLALAVAGAVWWLRPSRRRWGVVLVGGFLLMHLPTVLASEGFRNAARTIGAAPFLYLLVASGLGAVYRLVRRRGGAPAGVVVAGALLAVMVGINLHRYFTLYPRGLPYANTAVASVIAEYIDMLAPETAVHMVGSTWIDGMPEPKSIHYVLRRRPKAFREEDGRMDCARLAEIERPAVLIWPFQLALPSPRLAECAAGLTPQLYSSPEGLPLFHAASLHGRPGDGGSGALVPLTSAETTRAPIVLGGKQAEIRYQAIDMGQPSDLVDGDLQTLMRGTDNNPYRFELHWTEPTRLAGIRMWVGYVPEYQMDVVVRDAAGQERRFRRRDRPDPGLPLIDLQLPNGAIDAVSVAFTFTDFRDHPVEGWHFHLFELEPY